MKNTMRCLAIALAAVIGFSFAACDEDDGGADSALNGTWVNQAGEVWVFNNGNLTVSNNDGEFMRGTYSTSGNSITVTFTQIKGTVFGEDAADIGLSTSQWYTKSQLRSAIINYAVSHHGIPESQAATFVDGLLEEKFPFYDPMTGTYTLSGDTLTIGSATLTMQDSSSGGGGDIDSSLYGTWRNDDHSLIITFSSNYISLYGIVGNREWFDVNNSGPYGIKWTAKNGAISYGYYDPDATDYDYNKAYDYNIDSSGNLILMSITDTEYTLTKDDGSGTYGDFEYSYKAAKVIITGYTGNGGVVTIPSTIDGKQVVAIESHAFSGGYSSIVGSPGKGLTGVIIPNSVTAIYYGAFYGYGNELTSVTIGANVTLGNYYDGVLYYAFSGSSEQGGGLDYYYNDGGKLAGIYTSSDGYHDWTKQ